MIDNELDLTKEYSKKRYQKTIYLSKEEYSLVVNLDYLLTKNEEISFLIVKQKTSNFTLFEIYKNSNNLIIYSIDQELFKDLKINRAYLISQIERK